MKNMNLIQTDMQGYSEMCRKNDCIPEGDYQKYEVKRGLRDLSGQGVVAGLTNISKIVAFRDGKPCDGELW